MAILTAAQGAIILRTTNDDPAMLQLLPQVDAFIKKATGRDWAADATIDPIASAAAEMLLVMWHENPGQTGDVTMAPFGLTAALTMLEAMSQTLTFMGAGGIGYCSLPGACVGDQVAGLLCISPTPGDATSLFETIITYKDLIKQTSASNLALNTYRVRLKSAAVP